MLGLKFILNRPVKLEEGLQCEFKEIKGGKPVKIIKNTVDEYVVAYLNRNISGRILWGIRDADRVVVGVRLEYRERDLLKKDVISMLLNIQPTVTPSVFNIELYEVFQNPNEQLSIPDTYVVEVAVSEINTDELYFTGGNEAFIKTAAGKKKLSGPALLSEVIQRLKHNGKITVKDESDKK